MQAHDSPRASWPQATNLVDNQGRLETCASLCGDYRALASGRSLEEAEAAALERRLEFKYLYSVALPTCERALLIDPAGVAQPLG